MPSAVLVLVLLLAGLAVLSGCTVGVSLDTKVNDDGSGTVSVRLAADKDLQDTLSGATGGLGGLGSLFGDLGGLFGDSGGLLPDIPKSVDELFDTILGEIPGDWQVERGTDNDGTKWVAISRPFADPEELQTLLASSQLSSVVNMEALTLTQDEGFFGTKTRFSTTADVSGAMSQLGDAAAGLPLDLLSGVFVIQNRVTLPGTIGDNNADEVQGNTLIWNVGTSGAREMHAESMSYNWTAILGIIIAGGIVIAVLVVVLVLLLVRRRHTSPPQGTQPDDAPVAPAPVVVADAPPAPPSAVEVDGPTTPLAAAEVDEPTAAPPSETASAAPGLVPPPPADTPEPAVTATDSQGPEQTAPEASDSVESDADSEPPLLV